MSRVSWTTSIECASTIFPAWTSTQSLARFSAKTVLWSSFQNFIDFILQKLFRWNFSIVFQNWLFLLDFFYRSFSSLFLTTFQNLELFFCISKIFLPHFYYCINKILADPLIKHWSPIYLNAVFTMNRVEFDKLEEINFATKVDEMGSMKVEIFISHLSILKWSIWTLEKYRSLLFHFLDFFIRIGFPGNNRKIRRRQIRGAVVIDDEDARLPCGRNEQFQLVVQWF